MPRKSHSLRLHPLEHPPTIQHVTQKRTSLLSTYLFFPLTFLAFVSDRLLFSSLPLFPVNSFDSIWPQMLIFVSLTFRFNLPFFPWHHSFWFAPRTRRHGPPDKGRSPPCQPLFLAAHWKFFFLNPQPCISRMQIKFFAVPLFLCSPPLHPMSALSFFLSQFPRLLK